MIIYDDNKLLILFPLLTLHSEVMEDMSLNSFFRLV